MTSLFSSGFSVCISMINNKGGFFFSVFIGKAEVFEPATADQVPWNPHRQGKEGLSFQTIDVHVAYISTFIIHYDYFRRKCGSV